MKPMKYRYYSRDSRKPAELLLVPMIDIFTVLVTFLLMTAVFSRFAILQLDLPSSRAGKPTEPTFRLEVIVRKDGLELTDGKTTVAAIPNVNGEYDLKRLTDAAVALKREHPDADSASVLMDENVQYDDLIQVMDAIRDAEVPATATADLGGAGSPESSNHAGDRRTVGTPGLIRVALFTKIAVGDAP